MLKLKIFKSLLIKIKMLKVIIFVVIPLTILGFNNILRPVEDLKYNRGYDQRNIDESENITSIKLNFYKKDLLDKLESNDKSVIEKLLWIHHPIYNDILPFINQGYVPNLLGGGLLDDYNFEID